MPQPVESLTIVLIGDFNPSIFQPHWFAAHSLLAEGEAQNADVEVIAKPVSSFQTESYHITVTIDRFSASTTDKTMFDHLVDLVEGTFRVLCHTPIRRMGINFATHVDMESRERRDRLGFGLVPREPWLELLPTNEGMVDLTVQGRRDDGREGFVRVTVQPSGLWRESGVYLQVNDHYELGEDPNGAAHAIKILRDNWEKALDRSRVMLNGLVGQAVK